MKNPTKDDAYHALFRSYEDSNKRIKELECQLAYEVERNANNCGIADLQIADLQARLAAEEALNVKNAADAYHRIIKLESELIGMQAEITRLRAGGCARDQHTTQYCGEMQSLIARLTALAEEFQTEETWDGKRNDALRYCAGRLREAIGGGEEVKWTH